MSQPDFSASPGKVWPFGLVPTVDAPPSLPFEPLDPNRQLYLSSFGPLLTAFQVAHVVAFGGVLTPAHYQAEAWLRLHEGADLGRDSDLIAGALKTDLWLAVRLYLRHRGLEAQLMEAERSLQNWAEGGLLAVHGRRLVHGMATLRRDAHSPVRPVEFMSGQKLAIFGNRLGEGPGAITDLRFRMDDAPVTRAMSLHVLRYPVAGDDQDEAHPEPLATKRIAKLSQASFASDQNNWRLAADRLQPGQALGLRPISRHLADLYREAGHPSRAKDLADNMKSNLRYVYADAAVIAEAIGWTGPIEKRED